jgi:sugar phosphate isomerase/epimerase
MQPIYGFMNEIQQLKQMREQRQQQEAIAVVEDSSDLPYFDDLRDDMADLLDIAAKRGVEMTLQQAYEKAVAINPDISAAVSKQKAIEEAKRNGGTRLARARRAASTITGAPAGVPGGHGKPSSRKEALEAAWDDMAQQ